LLDNLMDSTIQSREEIGFRVLSSVVECLKRRFNLIAIILTGSKARGDYKPWSDYNLLITGDFDKPYWEKHWRHYHVRVYPLSHIPTNLLKHYQFSHRGIH